MRGRWRESAAIAFLRPAKQRQNLKFELNAHVAGLVYKGDKVVGVGYQQYGELKTAYAEHEVILSAGAVQSPQLLQLNGIGLADFRRINRSFLRVWLNIRDSLNSKENI